MGEIKQTSYQESKDDLNLKCPKCGAALVSRKYSYMCGGCDFKVNKEIAGKKIDTKILKSLLEKRSTSTYTFKKRDGSTFKAKLILKDDMTVGFSWSQSSGKRKNT